jgi:NadR type nicotinamide-nucleotide adenylyltransferase
MLQKIVVIGPESTGKSTLCEQLADHFHTSWCPEYARAWMEKNGNIYNYDDLLTIAKGQLAMEESCSRQAIQSEQQKIFIDTDMYVMKVWCEFVFEKCHPFILKELVQRHCDLYMLCDIDLPWKQDGLREYPDLATRKRLFNFYRELMIEQAVPWVVINGESADRLQKAIGAVEKLRS